ncbi:unnamed protein product [Closterium sp. NIES-54]
MPCSPARRALLPSPARAPLFCASRPAAACALRPTAPRVAPCCSPRVALCCSARHALLQPACRALLPCASRPAAARASRLARPARRALLQPVRRALLPRASRPAQRSPCCPIYRAPCPAAHGAPCPAARGAPCCPVHRAPCPAARGASCLAQTRRPARAALPSPSRAALPRSPAPPSCPAATTAAACATATAGGGAAGSAGSAAGAGGATGSAGGAAGAGGAGGATECLRCYWYWSFASGFFSEPVQVVEALFFCVLHRGGSTFSPQVLSELVPQRCVTGSVEAAALGASESAAALGASESAAALGASESVAALGASESTAAPNASESAAALGARASPATGPSSAEALHTFTLDSGASRCFFRDCTTLTPLAALVPVSLVDPNGGPVVARASTDLPGPAVPSGSLSRLHLPRFLTNLVSNAAIQDVWVDTCIPGGQRGAICICSRTGRHLATFTRWLGSSLYTLTTASAQVAEAGQVPAFPGTYTRYTTVFPLRRKADVSGVLIPWIRATRRQLRERFRRDFPVLRLHSDRGGEFSSNLLAEFCRDEGIHQSFTLPASPQQNGIAERRIGLIMEVAHTSMIHAAAPHFLWPFAVRYAAHQLNLWPRGPAPSGVSQVDPPPLVEPLKISSDSSGPAEGGDPADDNTPAAVDSGAEIAGVEPGGAETEGEGSGGAATGGAATGGASSWVAATGATAA